MRQKLRADRFKAERKHVSQADIKKYKEYVRKGVESKPLPTKKPKVKEPSLDLWSSSDNRGFGKKKRDDWKWLQETKPKTAKIILPHSGQSYNPGKSAQEEIV